MSINSLTNDALKRSVGFQEAAQATVASIDTEAKIARAASDKAAQDNRITNALNLLIKFISTESVTLYLAAVSAAPALQSICSGSACRLFTHKALIVIFLGLTLIFTLATYAAKRSALGLSPMLPSILQWPWWQIVAAVVAFFFWALAVPGNSLLESESGGVVAGFLAVFVSILLSVGDTLFGSTE